jgi:adenylate cyclase
LRAATPCRESETGLAAEHPNGLGPTPGGRRLNPAADNIIEEVVQNWLPAQRELAHVMPIALAIVACALARDDDAIRYAREAYEIRAPDYLFFSRYFPLASRLYRYPQFCETIRQMGRSDWLRDQPPLTATQEPRAQE